jgi:hypothetical protein
VNSLSSNKLRHCPYKHINYWDNGAPEVSRRLMSKPTEGHGVKTVLAAFNCHLILSRVLVNIDEV